MKNQQQTVLTMDEKSRSSGNLTSRPSTTPNASNPFLCGAKSSRTLSDSENDNGLISASSPGLIPKTDRTGAGPFSRRRLSKFRRFNSDTSNEGKNESLEDQVHANKTADYSLLSRSNVPQTNLFLNPSESCLGGSEKSGFISICRSPRPISRCHIDINMNDSENINLNLMEDQKVSGDTSDHLFDTTVSTDVLSSAPLIKISTERNSSTEERRESQNPPSIQILINSLDSAKGEVNEDEKTEQPKLSVREQRRRSALCRANSKQVDDFLLVHNLRDLGLL
ncbi:uncharacterized protein LOC116294714 [Actinia tenebrosa]|uniref:Uncharacterized protein LOC116294714 n=1 Tax=Actinia tenebrosa TaxID=6105 RepID=A0A6P8HPA3_ACTTE|nr:uncharacterized protein LOC116294714 [Actinia tenebrosa]